MFALTGARRPPRPHDDCFQTHHSLDWGAEHAAWRKDRSSAWTRTSRPALWISPLLLGSGVWCSCVVFLRKIGAQSEVLNDALPHLGQAPRVRLPLGMPLTSVRQQAEALQAPQEL